MGNESNRGLQISPLALWITAGLGGALWTVLFVQSQRSLDRQEKTQEAVTALVTSQAYDRREIDELRDDVDAMRVDVRGVSERLGKLEARR